MTPIAISPDRAWKLPTTREHQFLSLLGAPGAGKSTFLRYIGLMALRSGRLDTTAQDAS